MGHGYVTPNPDGSTARCGGPLRCKQCALELASQWKQEDYVFTTPEGAKVRSWDMGHLLEKMTKGER